MKTCFKCHKDKPLVDFYPHKEMKDGHLNKCKECTKKDTYERRHGPGREKVLAYDKARSATNKRIENRRVYTKKWISEYPERKKASSAVSYAVRSMKLVRWPVCALPECTGKPVAHHPNYSAPISVVWLCQAHHKQAHSLTDSLMRGSE